MSLESWEEMEARHAKERAECLARLLSEAASDLASAMQHVGVSGLDIVAARVSAMYGIPIEALRGKSRVRRLTVPRHHAFFMAARAGYSLSQIGRFFGRDHTTVKFGVDMHEKRRRAKAKAAFAVAAPDAPLDLRDGQAACAGGVVA